MPVFASPVYKWLCFAPRLLAKVAKARQNYHLSTTLKNRDDNSRRMFSNTFTALYVLLNNHTINERGRGMGYEKC